MSLGNLQLKAAASHSTMYPGNKRKKLWREEKGIAALPTARCRAQALFSRLCHTLTCEGDAAWGGPVLFRAAATSPWGAQRRCMPPGAERIGREGAPCSLPLRLRSPT